MKNRGVLFRRLRPCSNTGVIGCQSRIPFFENAAEGAVEGLSAGLQEKVRAFRRLLHLLHLAEAFADQNVDCRLDKKSRDQLSIASALSVIGNQADVVSDIGGKFGGGFGEPFQVGIVAFQDVDILGQSVEADQSLAAIAVPKPPLNPIETVINAAASCGS